METEINESQLKVNLKDSIIKEALNSGVDLRQYSQQIEQQLQEVSHISSFQSWHYCFIYIYIFIHRLNLYLLKIT